MYFQILQRRLVAAIRERVRKGELTERSLARLSGVSQPHIHNVLKGARILSPEFADQVLRQLRITVLDLCEREDGEPGPALFASEAGGVSWVPRLPQRVGPGTPALHPGSARPIFTGGDCYPFPAAVVERLVLPRLATLTEDPAMAPRFRAGDTVLLDSSETLRAEPDPRTAYVVNTAQGALVRYLRLGGRRLYLVSERRLHDRRRWDSISLTDRHILEVVRARIVWMGRQMES